MGRRRGCYSAEALAKQIATFSLAGIKAVAQAQRIKPSDAETVADYIPPERVAACTDSARR